MSGRFDAAIRHLKDHERFLYPPDLGVSPDSVWIIEEREIFKSAIAVLEAAGKVAEADAIGAECGVITEDALDLINKAALPEVEGKPRRYRCEGCGRTFDEKLFSHSVARDDGKGNPIEVECGPIAEVKEAPDAKE